MVKKTIKKKYKWQPELALSIIYWSITFSTLFLSVISLLEANGFSPFFVVFITIFLGLVFCSQQRSFQIDNDSLMIVAILKKNSYHIPLNEIETIKIGAYGLTFFGEKMPIKKEEDRSFLMWQKSKEAFINQLQEESLFTGEIVSIKKSVG